MESLTLVFAFAIFVSLWMIGLAGISLHEALSDTSDAYKNAVKYISGISIAAGAIVVIVASWAYVKQR